MLELDIKGIRISSGEHAVLLGPDGSGKEELASYLALAYSGKVSLLRFRDSYGAAADKEYFHQLRWNHGMMDDDEPTGRERLMRSVSGCADQESAMAAFHKYTRLFGLEPVMDKPLITYSSGEMRKLRITRALLSSPEALVIEYPYIGLDPGTRDLLTNILEELSRTRTVVLVLSRADEIPDFMTHVVTVSGGLPVCKYSLEEYRRTFLPPEVVRFKGVTVRYGERTILRDLNWTVREGEHWALTGENGCGKSTLLSLVCADNPMAYACDISLFGRKRGTGESIWDIKRKIGYVSPEMHRAFRSTENGLGAVASGLTDTGASLSRMTPEQKEECLRWMEVFGITDLADVPFLRMDSAQQRICLVCRAFVKNPPLLILDEPLHGLDAANRVKVRGIIDDYCKEDPSRTLVMVTHYPEEFPSCIDHSLTLRKSL
ncbi:MAG: ATP-binding cassette domain-containing protein [Bacteroidales bacterium]|nr:ATP-binding cassette domain-containing protein [Bacteroidales bacterium]